MSQQDSPTPDLPYGENPSLISMALEAVEIGIQAEYRKKKRKIPQGDKLRKMARDRLQSSIQNGRDNHIGTAERLT